MTNDERLIPVSFLEFCIIGWMAYHKAADKVDGHLKLGDPEQYKLTNYAVKAGFATTYNAIGIAGMNPYAGRGMPQASRTWQAAKLIALRRLGL